MQIKYSVSCFIGNVQMDFDISERAQLESSRKERWKSLMFLLLTCFSIYQHIYTQIRKLREAIVSLYYNLSLPNLATLTT